MRHQAAASWSLGYSGSTAASTSGAQGTRSSSGYRDVAALYASSVATTERQRTSRRQHRHTGNFGISYVHLRYPASQTSRYASGYWYRSFGSTASLSLNLNQNLDDARDRSLFLSFSLSLDDRTYMSTGVDRQGSRVMADASITRALPTEGRLRLARADAAGGRHPHRPGRAGLPGPLRPGTGRRHALRWRQHRLCRRQRRAGADGWSRASLRAASTTASRWFPPRASRTCR